MKKSWWKVSLYCTLAGVVCFNLEVRLLRKWTLVTLPDGSVTVDSNRWMAMSAVLFLAVVCLGGFLLFRRMTRREIFCSASILAMLNIVLNLLSQINIFRALRLFLSVVAEWDSIFPLLLNHFGLNGWFLNTIVWLLPPYIFVLFGKKDVSV